MRAVLALLLLCAGFALAQEGTPMNDRTMTPIRPGNPEWPMVWTTYRNVVSLEEDVADLRLHGVGLIDYGTGNVQRARELLALCRRSGMKLSMGLPEITQGYSAVRNAGLTPVNALMVGGVYQGKATDRHLYRFSAARHEIIVEPPVYNQEFAYTRGSAATGAQVAGEKIAHYYPDMGAPVRAEIVVPLKRFDGRQHLKIIQATISEAPADAKPEIDSVTPEMPVSSETANRKLYRLSFNLTGLDNALLDQVGIALYWPYQGSNQFFMFGGGHVSAWAESTRQALRLTTRRALTTWIEANDGVFPLDVVLAGRFGDECFYITGHLNGPAVSYPLWDYSEPAIAAFKVHAGEIEYPRTWGFPEIYGTDSYAWWQYTLHEGTARLAGILREEIADAAPGLLVYRNTTRTGIFELQNDHDGSGQELLAQNLDVIHLDPYPVNAAGYNQNIPRDMSYCAGLARRYHRLLIPWMQAHTYGGPTGLQDVTPEQVSRMADEQWQQGVDAIMWLGYGYTFPNVRADSWEKATEFHRKLAAGAPPKPQPRLAVLRSYRSWALTSRWEEQIRNPGDWLLTQFLDVWAADHGQPYDVFELPPVLTHEAQVKLDAELKNYPLIVSNIPRDGAWVIGAGTESQVIDPATAAQVRQGFEEELLKRGWLK